MRGTRAEFAGTRSCRSVLWLLAGVTFLLAADTLKAGNLPDLPQRRLMRTNPPGLIRRPPGTNVLARGVVTNAPFVPARPQVKTNAPAKAPPAAAATTNRPARLPELVQRWSANRAFYPALAGVLVCAVALALLALFKPKQAKASKGVSLISAAKPLPATYRPKTRAAVRSCNVLEVGAQARQVWQFEARGGGFALDREQTCLEGERLPTNLVRKSWTSLFQPKLNIAWLPAENVFLRVTQLPKSDFEETLSMVELQLEKLSPMPVAQIVWTFHSMPHVEGNLQTVIVILVARSVVEEFLGKLESEGYLADRLELPLLDQLQTTVITADGAWIYPEAAGGKNTALVAWWYGGVLRNLDLLTLPLPNQPGGLKEQLLQMTWAGELDGWLTSAPEWHLVTDAGASEWESALRAGLDEPVEIVKPRPESELAAMTARRSAQAEPRSNLLPVEYAARYQQQFVDRLWMKGLLAVGALYLLGLVVYAGRLAYATVSTDGLESQVAALGQTYTNAIQLRDRYRVLKDRQELKYAGLDCWNTTARLLPEEATLDSLNFTEGKKLNLSGTAPADQIQKLYDFEREMRKATVNDQPLFDKGESLQWRSQGDKASWTLNLELKRGEVQ